MRQTVMSISPLGNRGQGWKAPRESSRAVPDSPGGSLDSLEAAGRSCRLQETPGSSRRFSWRLQENLLALEAEQKCCTWGIWLHDVFMTYSMWRWPSECAFRNWVFRNWIPLHVYDDWDSDMSLHGMFLTYLNSEPSCQWVHLASQGSGSSFCNTFVTVRARFHNLLE